MHGPFDRVPKGEPNIYENWRMTLVALPVLLAIALIGYAVSHPEIAKWVSDGVQAEFVGANSPEGTPKRIAKH